ncbi:MAG TPA: GIY-YIG nuclease family protein [Planctomycetota bacterium]
MTSVLAARVITHNQGQGAKYTRSRLPVRLAYAEPATSRSEALRREHQIKKLSKEEKEVLCRRWRPVGRNCLHQSAAVRSLASRASSRR